MVYKWRNLLTTLDEEIFIWCDLIWQITLEEIFWWCDTSYSKTSSDHDTSSSSKVLLSNILRMLLPPQKVLLVQKKRGRWKDLQKAFGDRTGSAAYDNLTRSENGVEQQEETMYPERPGLLECSHYMRQGYCKIQMNCKYHHQGDRLSKKPYDSLNSSTPTTWAKR